MKTVLRTSNKERGQRERKGIRLCGLRDCTRRGGGHAGFLVPRAGQDEPGLRSPGRTTSPGAGGRGSSAAGAALEFTCGSKETL
jgi:hypothetical protein